MTIYQVFLSSQEQMFAHICEPPCVCTFATLFIGVFCSKCSDGRWDQLKKKRKICQPLKAVQPNMADRSISNLRIKLPLNCARTKPGHGVVDYMSVLHISAWKSETPGDEALLIGWDYITVLHLSSSGAQSFLWLIFPYGDSGAECSAGQI